jgi:hypothetical protein
MKTPKTHKTSLAYQQKTLDTHHSTKLKTFEDSAQELGDLREQVGRLNDAILAAEARGKANLASDELDAYLCAKDERAALLERIDKIEKSDGEIEYYVNAGNILFQYYDVLEKGNGGGGGATGHGGNGGNATVSPANSILRYFTSSASSSADKPENPEKPRPKTEADRASLLDKYMMSVNNGTHVRAAPAAAEPPPSALGSGTDDAAALGPCEHCRSKDRTAMWNEGYVVCNACSTIENLLVDHEKPSYKDPFPEITYWAYKRINHLMEWVSQIQGRETTDIPDEVYDKILFEIKKQKIVNLADVTTTKLKEILKKLGGKYNKYYEHIPHILHRLNGLPVPHLSPELEERLRQMFFQIQVPFLKHAPPTRRNFLSYSYVLNKFMTLLNQDQYLPSFPLLKSRDKLHQQDMIWKKICEELGWEFVRSI